MFTTLKIERADPNCDLTCLILSAIAGHRYKGIENVCLWTPTPSDIMGNEIAEQAAKAISMNEETWDILVADESRNHITYLLSDQWSLIWNSQMSKLHTFKKDSTNGTRYISRI